MKKILFNIYILLLGLLIISLIIHSCKDDDESLGDPPRIFSPVLDDVRAVPGENAIVAKWRKSPTAISYTADISTDTFKTILSTVGNISGSEYTFTGLGWESDYQIRVKAIPADPSQASDYTWLGGKSISVGTFTGVVIQPASEDILDRSIRVGWANNENTINRIEIRSGSWQGAITLEYTVTDEDNQNYQAIIDGLSPSTKYAVLLYSSADVLEGYTYYATMPAIVGDNIIDLRDSEYTEMTAIDNDFLTNLSEGAIVLLEGGKTYTYTGNISKSVVFTSAYSFSGRGQLEPVNQFNITANSDIDSIIFRNVNVVGNVSSGYGGHYIMNISTASNVARIIIDNCTIRRLRGICRTQNAAGPQVDEVYINNCIIDSINNYGLINCDNANSTIAKMIVSNSTVSNTQKGLVNTRNSTTIEAVINNCTFYNFPLNGNYVMDFNGQTATKVTVTSNLFGPAWKSGENQNFNTYRGTITNLTGLANYLTSDVTDISTNKLPAQEVLTESSTQVWNNPENGDFTVISTKVTVGDPRWFQ